MNGKRAAWVVLAIGVVLFLGAVSQPHPAGSGGDAGSPDQGSGPSHLVVFTYFYYWYDAATGLHLGPDDPLPLHPADDPPPSWHSVAWFERQLSDMAYAGIDVVLPVYWGFGADEPWSWQGLRYLVDARDRLVAAGRPAPSIGLFLDTTIFKGMDLTDEDGIGSFYANIQDFLARIPPRDRALIDGRPVVWLFLPQENVFDQRTFDEVDARFEADFGVRPFVVRATGWDCAMERGFLGLGSLHQDCSHPIRTDASYVWGAAQDGFQETATVATVGPGYDERLIPGRPGVYRSREGGARYRDDLCRALASGRNMLAIETWNEFHEASAIAETLEYGRKYIEMTRALLAPFEGRASEPQTPAPGRFPPCPA
jgi:hypothetical protein